MSINTVQKTTTALLDVLLNQRRISELAETKCTGILCSECIRHPQEKIQQAVREQRPLTLILPAFPAKSANRQKTLSEKPDRGEIIGLSNLNQICHTMQEIYPVGIKLIICSDGRVFNDLVLVSDLHVDVYQKGIQQIIEDYQLTHLSTFSLDELYPCHNYQIMRELLMIEFGQTLDELKQHIATDPSTRYQFNGIHRFITEDQFALKPQQTKSKTRQEAKRIAYEVMRRSNAWSRLLANYFPQSVRLSIHPQPCGSEKIGIHFLPTSNRWGTPWHNVLLKNADGWQLIKRREAEQLGARLNNDHYVLEAC
ncbi:isocyanide synthase family protein [Fluoribacter gormanii]|uniref:isocyanide synthase family protein n=1 Tax=Fluoribacter gormanii TaxID=464 RepID=UPI001041A1E9|nr:isocyanide synthase family protein [Fluoribacter gormanii]